MQEAWMLIDPLVEVAGTGKLSRVDLTINGDVEVQINCVDMTLLASINAVVVL